MRSLLAKFQANFVTVDECGSGGGDSLTPAPADAQQAEQPAAQEPARGGNRYRRRLAGERQSRAVESHGAEQIAQRLTARRTVSGDAVERERATERRSRLRHARSIQVE